MNVAGFVVVAAMIAVYAVLDGYDLGLGAVLHLYGRNAEERRRALKTIGPFWNGNEVWLIAAGATLFALFPLAYAVSFSGFYLPLIIALWLLMGRGIAFELRGHIDGTLWRDFWDTVFAVSSGLLIVVFGVALGNLVRGLPTAPGGFFRGSFALLLNPYAVAVGVFALIVLAYHGTGWLAMTLDDAGRARKLQRRLWWIVVSVFAVVAGTTPLVHPFSAPWVWALPIVFLVQATILIGAQRFADAGRPRASFAASSAFIACLVLAAAATIFPYLVPGLGGTRGVSIYDDAPNPAAFAVIFAVLVAGLAAVTAYTLFVTRKLLER